jgi:hypothetical protein
MSSLLKSPWTWFASAAVVFAGYFLLQPSPYSRGVEEAYADHERGHYEIKSYGYPAPWLWEYRRVLQERYGVKLNRVADCVVTERLVSYVGGYNEVSTRLLNEKYGRDIFKECMEFAEKKYEEDHPQWQRGPAK